MPSTFGGHTRNIGLWSSVFSYLRPPPAQNDLACAWVLLKIALERPIAQCHALATIAPS